MQQHPGLLRQQDLLDAFSPSLRMKCMMSVILTPVEENLSIPVNIAYDVALTVLRIFISASNFVRYSFPIASHLFGHNPGNSSEPSQQSGSKGHGSKYEVWRIQSIAYHIDHR